MQTLVKLPGSDRQHRSKVMVIRCLGPEREQLERKLIECGVAIPLTHSVAWAREFAATNSWFVAALDSAGHCHGGVAVDVIRSRALAKHVLLRVPRCGAAKTDEALIGIIATLKDLAANNWRVLRVGVELFSLDGDFRAMAAKSLAEYGFRPVASPRSYTKTLMIDLSPSEEEILGRLSANTRREIRASNKKGFEVKPITDTALSDRMEAIRRETLQRTGGAYIPRTWESPIRFCQCYPHLSRLVGLFRANANGPESLLAYSWGLHHSDHAQYHTSASVRDDNIKFPLAYGLMWDLICWAKRHGASWFDLGGVTLGSVGDKDDRLGGISDFKRSFSKTVVSVGEEWELEPRPLRALIASTISKVARFLLRK